MLGFAGPSGRTANSTEEATLGKQDVLLYYYYHHHHHHHHCIVSLSSGTVMF